MQSYNNFQPSVDLVSRKSWIDISSDSDDLGE
jgi:hypothetical protein